MPKHALPLTREKPSADPSVAGVSPGIPTPVVVSNEVLLRSKIAQLQLEKATQHQQQQQQQRKAKPRKNATAAATSPSSFSASSSASSGAAGRQAADGATFSLSLPSASASRRGRGVRVGRPVKKPSGTPSKHQLASAEAERGLPGGERTAVAKWGATGASVGGLGRAGAQASRLAGRPESEKDTMRRFEDQVAVSRKRHNPENSTAAEESSEVHHHNHRQQQQPPGFTPEGIQALLEMYREQVRATRLLNKQADVLTRKTQEMEKSNELMVAEAEACTREVARLDQAAGKLDALSAELDGRRTGMLETRKIEAAEEAAKREEMNASLNAVVGDISKKIKEQEEERLAQDAENSSLRSDLQELLRSYDESKNASETALRAHEEKGAKLARRLEDLTAAAQTSVEREEKLTNEIRELNAAEGKLRERVGEHAKRLQRQEAGLKTYLDSVQRLQAEETALLVSIARLSKDKSALLARAGCLAAGDVVAGGVRTGGRDGGGGGDGDGEGEMAENLVGNDWMRALLRGKEQHAAEMEREKDRWQARCRELQAERKRIAAEADALATAASAGMTTAASAGMTTAAAGIEEGDGSGTAEEKREEGKTSTDPS